MKKMNFFVVISILTLMNLKASAVTSLNFFISGQAMVNVISQSLDGRSDQDPVELYKLMNVDPAGSLIGPGKGIVTDNRDLNMTCGSPPGRGATCSFIFQNSPRVKINPLSKTIIFHAVGKEAIALSKLFVTNDGKLEFLSSDKMLKIEVSAQEVLIEASEQ
jgi:hypothetical protein